jgi:hypothetical protein
VSTGRRTEAVMETAWQLSRVVREGRAGRKQRTTSLAWKRDVGMTNSGGEGCFATGPISPLHHGGIDEPHRFQPHSLSRPACVTVGKRRGWQGCLARGLGTVRGLETAIH